jgi:hypothetical protein
MVTLAWSSAPIRMLAVRMLRYGRFQYELPVKLVAAGVPAYRLRT